MKLYTVIISFSDQRQAIEQYEAETPFDALKRFIDKAESLNHFDRGKILAALKPTPLIQTKPFKGLWFINFSPEITKVRGLDTDALLGGYVLQSDPEAPMRK